MNKNLLVILTLILSFKVRANDICSRSQDDLKTLLSDTRSRISFKNKGGMFGQGVCWWHSRLQRSSLYLANFRPDLNPPSRPEVMKIVNDFRQMNKIVTIPGYENFESFSKDHKTELQNMLDQWQIYDGVINAEWVRGISGQSSLPMNDMILRMKDVYKYYKSSPTPLWVMAQMKGITSHALLIVNMKEIPYGYEMDVIDSNYPSEIHTLNYQEGDISLKGPEDKYTFVPYVGFQNDFILISKALRTRCKNKVPILDLQDFRPGQVELPEVHHNTGTQLSTRPQYQ